MKYISFVWYLGTMLVLADCQSKSQYSGIPETNTVTIDVNTEYWTYFSFRTENFVGIGYAEFTGRRPGMVFQDRLGYSVMWRYDPHKQQDLRKRNGGIQEVGQMSYGAIINAPANGYDIDTDDVMVKQ